MIDDTPRRDLLRARDTFRALLGQDTLERDWQAFFSEHPYVLSRSLGLRLSPSDILPLARPGHADPDFAFYPKGQPGVPVYGLIELKKPSTPIVVVQRSDVAILSRDAETAVQQLRRYSRPDRIAEFIPIEARRALFLGNAAHLFAIIGCSRDLEKLSLDVYRDMVESCLPPNLRIMPFDELLCQFERSVPRRLLVLVPYSTPDQALLWALWSETEGEAVVAAVQLQAMGWRAPSPQEDCLLLLALRDEGSLKARVDYINAIAWKFSHPEVVRHANHISMDLAYDDDYWPRWPKWASRCAARLLKAHGRNTNWYAGDE